MEKCADRARSWALARTGFGVQHYERADTVVGPYTTCVKYLIFQRNPSGKTQMPSIPGHWHEQDL